ncbi:tyrosine-type recombinase/integrase [Candidatus Latescibacterota bacterium]
MPRQKRYKTNKTGVYFIDGESINGKTERIYYIRYRKDGKLVEEKAGRQFRDDMTPAKASHIRTLRVHGDQTTNREKREKIETKRKTVKWTMNLLWQEYCTNKPHLKGIITDESRYRLHIMPNIGNKEPDKLSPFEVDRIRIKLLKTHKPQTVAHVLTLIKRIINFGVAKQLCTGLSFKIEMPRVDNKKTEDLSADQLSSLLKALDEEPNIQAANFMRMALFTGMRRGELFRLKWNDVDFQRGFITIRESKGGRGQAIPLNDNARQVLDSHPHSDSEYVFPGKDGNQRTNFKKPIIRIKERAGLPKDFRPLHGLRHVYASMLASSGQVDMYTLQKLLTHKSPQMTQRYAHLRDDTLKRASNLVGDIIEQAVSKELSKSDSSQTA